MITPATRWHVALNPATKHDEPSVITRACRSRKQRERSMHGRIEFCLLLDARRHESTSIECDQDRLIAFDLILACREFSASCCRGPGDVTQFVAAHVVAHRFKLASLAAPRSFAMCGNNRTRAEGFQLCFTSATHVWINLHGYRLDDFRLTPDQFELRSEAQRSLSK